MPETVAPAHPRGQRTIAEQGTILGQPTIVQNLKPSFPDVPMELDSAFYISPSCEQECYEEVLTPGQIIRIWAPQKMGKTSLLYRILNFAEQEGYHTISLDLKHDLERSQLSHLGDFFGWFGETIAKKLELSIDTKPTTKTGCTDFLQSQILEKVDAPLVIALDQAEVLFEYPEMAQEFFPLLRAWHNKHTDPGSIGEKYGL